MATLTLDTFLSTVLPRPQSPARLRDGAAIAQNVRHALTAIQPGWGGVERRREARFLYPYPIYLTPLTEEGQADLDQTLVVIGKHLSEHGLDFYHRQPVPQRRVIASLDGGSAGWVGLLLELNWCRFTRHGWYDNGGRFVSIVDSPLNGT